MRLAVTQTPVKKPPANPDITNSKGVNNNSNNNNNNNNGIKQTNLYSSERGL